MSTEVFGVSTSIVFAKNGSYAVFTQGVKTRSKQLQNLVLAFNPKSTGLFGSDKALGKGEVFSTPSVKFDPDTPED